MDGGSVLGWGFVCHVVWYCAEDEVMVTARRAYVGSNFCLRLVLVV